MAARKCCRLFTASLAFLLILSGSSEAQQLTPAQITGAAQTCTYQYAIPIGGNCVTYGPAVQQKMDAMKQEMDRSKLQFLSLTNNLQDQIRGLVNKGANTDTRLTDLTVQVSSLRDAVQALTRSVAQAATGGARNNGNNGNNGNANRDNPNNEMLLQLMTATKAQLTADIQKLTSDLSSLRNLQQQHNTQQSAVEAELKSQVKQQQTEIDNLHQGLVDLHDVVTQQLQRLQASGSGPSSLTQSSQLSAAIQQLNTLLKDVQKDLTDVQSRVASLEDSRRIMQQKVDNQSLATGEAANQIQFLKTRINDLQKNVDKAVTILPSLQSQVQAIAVNISALTQQINSLGFNTLTATTQQRTTIEDMKTMIKILTNQLSDVRKALETNAITTKIPPTTTYAAPTARGANAGNVVTTPRSRPGR